MVKRISKMHKLTDMIANKQVLKVGVLGEAVYPDGTNVAQVAFDNEYGSPKARPRPFFRNAINANRDSWKYTLVSAMKSTGLDTSNSLKILGTQMVSDIYGSILDGSYAPNSPVTLLLKDRFPDTPEEITDADVQKAIADVKKGIGPAGTHNKPLVWTGKLQESISFEVAEDES